MNQQQENLISLIKGVLKEEIPKLQEPDFQVISAMAQHHGVTAMLYPAYRKLPASQRPEEKIMGMAKQLCYGAATRCAIQKKEAELVIRSLREAQIRALPLKGIVLRQLYPSPELRTMSDCDFLIDEEKAAKVKDILCALGFQANRYGLSDTDFYISPTMQNFEIHRDLRAEGIHKETKTFLGSLLDIATPDDAFGLCLSPEEHYVYIVSHFAKHFVDGTVGLRPVIDIWLCLQDAKMDHAQRKNLLRKAKLYDFSNAVEALARFWFEGEAGNDDIILLSDYVFSGSYLGNEDRWQRTKIVKDNQHKSRFRYWLSRIFPRYEIMCSYFPKLEKAPVLLPFYWIFRFFRGLSKGKKLLKEARLVEQYDEHEIEKELSFFERYGLSLRK